VKEAESIAGGVVELVPVAAGLLEEDEGSVDVGADEGLRGRDGAVDVAFGGEVDDGAGTMGAEKRGDELGVADVSADEAVARVQFERREVGGISGVGEQIEIDDDGGRGLDRGENEVGADEAGAAGDEDQVVDRGWGAVSHDPQYMVQNTADLRVAGLKGHF